MIDGTTTEIEHVTEVFDSHTIRSWEIGQSFYLWIQSVQARTRSARLGGQTYRFSTSEKRDEWLESWKQSRMAKMQKREEAKQVKRKAAESFVNPYKVGDILHSSWGYEQTNVEWFEVVAAGQRSICVREIAGTQEETGFMSGYTRPKPGKYVGEKKWVTIQISVGKYGPDAGKVYHHVPSPIHGFLYPAASHDSKQYYSSYA